MAKNTLDETRALKVLLAQVRGFCESIQDILHNQDAAEICYAYLEFHVLLQL